MHALQLNSNTPESVNGNTNIIHVWYDNIFFTAARQTTGNHTDDSDLLTYKHSRI